jgi:hypothetical protein
MKRYANTTRMYGDDDTTRTNDEVLVRSVDYEAFAKSCGERAYRRAKDAGLGEEISSRRREAWGAPVDPEYRVS